MYVIELMADGDLAMDSVYSGRTLTHYLFCEDNNLYSTLYDMVENFNGTKLDGCFYDVLEVCDSYEGEHGNYSLNIMHDRTNIDTIRDAFELLCERELI